LAIDIEEEKKIEYYSKFNERGMGERDAHD